MADMPETGSLAPDFEGQIQDGSVIRLSDYRGKKVALYFYPADDTPGCTKQACNLRDDYRRLLDQGIAVIGVSADDIASHARFADKYDLPFPLVSDPEHSILNLYGIWGERSLYGRTVIGTKRTTFIIDEEGIIRSIIKRPRTDNHANEILKKVGA